MLTATPRADTMRFSLKWILAATVYVAIAASALYRKSPHYADLIWGISVIAIAYVVTLAIYTRGQRQAAAVAFLVSCLGFLAGLQFGSGDEFIADLLLLLNAYTEQFRFRAANAVAALAFGLMGSLVGLLAYRTATKAK
jgi:hypothetical protein